MGFEKKGDKIFITELPRGYDAQKIYKHLNKHIENDVIKDYIDNSVDNDINIELLFKRAHKANFDEVVKNIGVTTAQTPNYTLISERGVRIFDNPQDIIEIFTEQRLIIVRRRYELLLEDSQDRINKSNEIIRFIQEKHYTMA